MREAARGETVAEGLLNLKVNLYKGIDLREDAEELLEPFGRLSHLGDKLTLPDLPDGECSTKAEAEL